MITKLLPFEHIQRYLSPVYIFTNHFSKYYFNIIFPFKPSLPNGPFPSGFPTKMMYEFLVSPIYVTCLPHIFISSIILAIFSEEYQF